MPSSKKYPGLYYGNPTKADRRNYSLKLNNFQLFKKEDSNMNLSRKRDLVIACDLSCNLNEHSKIKTNNVIKVYCNGKSYNIPFENKKKKAISGKHYSYERYLAKKKGCVINKMIEINKEYLKTHIDKNTFKNKSHNPCSWESSEYSKNIVYKNMPKDKKNIFNKKPLPNGPAGAKKCSIHNCIKWA